MPHPQDSLSSQLNYEGWRDLLRSMCGRYYSEGIEPISFSGWVRPINVRGFTALDIGSNAQRVERTYQDVRRDGADHYFALFLASGKLTMIHNDEAVRLSVGDVALVDAARPVTYSTDSGSEPWNTVSLSLPRQSLVSYLGFEPQGGLYRRSGTPAGRLLLDLIRTGDGEGSALSPADPYMQLAVYDLVGALFAVPEPSSGSRHAHKLFARIRDIIKDGCADPDFGPHEAAAGAGISLRYLQKLFTERGSTCSDFIYSLRLDQAARLLHRRESLGANQPLTEIAYACGFRDYTHFSRKFRQRFGHPPGAHSISFNHLRERADENPIATAM
ncbi:MAG TPA: helix-turn-helix domain-containing protein [Pseudolabrys sp.]|nr:helix-turn-helix domain-containing protein [Pseudolabrys sp.]